MDMNDVSGTVTDEKLEAVNSSRSHGPLFKEIITLDSSFALVL